MNGDGGIGDRLLEIIAVILLAVTTLGTAWCGYQASQWSGVQSDRNQEQTNHRLEANRSFSLAVQTFSYDSSVIALYAQAVQSGNTGLRQFYRDTMVRDGLRPYLDRWEATVSSGGTPTPLLEDPQYSEAQLGAYRTEEDAAASAMGAAQDAGDISRLYVLNTVVLAIALFFAGVTASFRYLLVRTFRGVAPCRVAARSIRITHGRTMVKSGSPGCRAPNRDDSWLSSPSAFSPAERAASRLPPARAIRAAPGTVRVRPTGLSLFLT
jgi:hypothetical protein